MTGKLVSALRAGPEPNTTAGNGDAVGEKEPAASGRVTHPCDPPRALCLFAWNGFA